MRWVMCAYVCYLTHFSSVQQCQLYFDVSISCCLKQVHCWNENSGFFGRGWGVFGLGGRFCTRWVCVHVIAEKMKIYSYLHVIKYAYPQDDSRRADKFKCLYSRISLIWHQQNRRGAGVFSVLFIIQYLYWPNFLQVFFPLDFFIT
jgi:hypothetical protein